MCDTDGGCGAFNLLVLLLRAIMVYKKDMFQWCVAVLLGIENLKKKKC
jgi:hypothetical protein